MLIFKGEFILYSTGVLLSTRKKSRNLVVRKINGVSGWVEWLAAWLASVAEWMHMFGGWMR